MSHFSQLSDESLMKHYQEGESVAFDILYSRHNQRVFSYLKKHLFDPESHQEVFQNIFFKLHRSRSSYSEKYPFIKWLYVICRSETIDFLRKKNLTTIEFNEKLHTVDEILSNQTDIDLDKVSTLTQNEKAAINYKFNEDKDYTEMAQVLKTSEANVRKIISRAMAKIRKHFSKENLDER